MLWKGNTYSLTTYYQKRQAQLGWMKVRWLHQTHSCPNNVSTHASVRFHLCGGVTGQDILVKVNPYFGATWDTIRWHMSCADLHVTIIQSHDIRMCIHNQYIIVLSSWDFECSVRQYTLVCVKICTLIVQLTRSLMIRCACTMRFLWSQYVIFT